MLPGRSCCARGVVCWKALESKQMMRHTMGTSFSKPFVKGLALVMSRPLPLVLLGLVLQYTGKRYENGERSMRILLNGEKRGSLSGFIWLHGRCGRADAPERLFPAGWYSEWKARRRACARSPRQWRAPDRRRQWNGCDPLGRGRSVQTGAEDVPARSLARYPGWRHTRPRRAGRPAL